MPARLRDAFHVREFGYVANWLTLLRLGLLLPTVYYLRRPDGRKPALVCMGSALLTDAIDGPLARYRGEVSHLGEILDPIIDKVLIDTLAVTLSQEREFPWWATTMLLTRDISIVLAAVMIYRRKARITTAWPAGKVTTVGLATAMLIYTADGPRLGKPILYLVLIPYGVSVWQYSRLFYQMMHQSDKGTR